MPSIFRSEEMAMCQLFVQPEAAYNTLAGLGEIGVAQFRDLNPEVTAPQRRFTAEVLRVDAIEIKINYIRNELEKNNVPIQECNNDTMPAAPQPKEMVDLEAQIERFEQEIIELSENSTALNQDYSDLLELKSVLEKCGEFFENSTEFYDQTDAEPNQGPLNFISGVVKRNKFIPFERMLWRVSRGNVLMRYAEIEEDFQDAKTKNKVQKLVFTLFFQGEELKSRIKKICAGFQATTYPCPNDAQERQKLLDNVKVRLEDLKMVLNQTQDQQQLELQRVAKDLDRWVIMLKKMKSIYHALNFFNVDLINKCLIGECWIPKDSILLLQSVLTEGSQKSQSDMGSFFNVIESNEEPPTFFRSNKFSKGFQNLIDSYGLASYREVNPSLYTIITFPFLFAVMFGDVGHSLIMLAFGCALIAMEKNFNPRRTGEIMRLFFGGRYIILLMGLFSFYTGLIYNDVFSKGTNIFQTTWRVNYDFKTILGNDIMMLDPHSDALRDDHYYWFGLDPVWALAENKIIFLNSFKMKLSIIFGVIHMTFGVCMGVVNYCHFKRYSSIILDFVPQLLFLLLLFGYMVFMMFYKWVKYTPRWDDSTFPVSPSCAPSVLIMFINMMLFKSNDFEIEECGTGLLYSSQETVQKIFIFVAIICIPWLLLARPITIAIKRCIHKPKPQTNWRTEVPIETIGGPNDEANKSNPQLSNGQQGTDETPVDEDNEINKSEPQPSTSEESSHGGGGGSGGGGGGHGGHDDEAMGEIFILQAIHAIEYILSTISHTASYLRLWALSLAHAQLSEVLWNMVFRSLGLKISPSLGYAGCIIIFIIFAAWAALTVSILVILEGLSAFLHTLRLHWVEFMSKFYTGQGYPFQPFSFKLILDGELDEPMPSNAPRR